MNAMKSLLEFTLAVMLAPTAVEADDDGENYGMPIDGTADQIHAFGACDPDRPPRGRCDPDF